jgi:hypothetical protein
VGDEGYRISGPRAGVGPGLLASGVPLYSYLTGLEEILTGMDAWGRCRTLGRPLSGDLPSVARSGLASKLLLVLTEFFQLELPASHIRSQIFTIFLPSFC